MVKHAPGAAETIDSATQGASLFLDPTGSQVGEQVQGEEGIAYADLDLSACVVPKQFHDVVGYYQRFDVFDVKVNRRRQGPETAFQGDIEVTAPEPGTAPIDLPEPGGDSRKRPEHRHGLGGLRVCR